MIQLSDSGCYLINGVLLTSENTKFDLSTLNSQLPHNTITPLTDNISKEKAIKGTIAYQILKKHNNNALMNNLKIKFDALTSHDITFVGILQTAIASGLKKFPVPYVLTNCHNSLCAVGGTINEDDHVFGYSAAKKFGGIFVPPHQAVIHQFMRETMAGCGKMILGSDSHTRYGALGTMAIGEGGGEIVKQLLSHTYDIKYPDVIAIYLKGAPKANVGPQDVALSIIKAVFDKGYVKNKVMEFVGPGISNLSMDFRNGIDVMTTETTCLSSIWCTDEKTASYYKVHGRPEDYQKLQPKEIAYYQGAVEVDLSKIEPVIAMPFHPSNVFTIAEVDANAADILRHVEKLGQEQLENSKNNLTLMDKLHNGKLKVDQGIIAGCAGGSYENLVSAAKILGQAPLHNFSLSAYPASQPVFLELMKHGAIADLTLSGASIRSAFCGPCFGAGDTPANNEFSIRHTTRNFPHREGSKPSDRQLSYVALMDARSIAATAKNNGILTAASEENITIPDYTFNRDIYKNRVYFGFDHPEPNEKLVSGPNIVEWPKIRQLPKNLLLKVCAVIHDPVTTTDELIPSGETSSYRSNPLRLAEFTLSRKVPAYVDRAKAVQREETKRQAFLHQETPAKESLDIFAAAFNGNVSSEQIRATGIGSVIVAIKPGDGSAREQAASCQRVLGGDANIAVEYATKRYRSNLINWGMIPFTIDKKDIFLLEDGDLIYIADIRQAITTETTETTEIPGELIQADKRTPITLKLENLSAGEREIIADGCLINYYNKNE
ncbi:hydratase [Anaerosinus massiliensis]|uniref:hydratase n=1 Tax=Massilibacillus massiliensis TaxID=1806837 RepID=UPI000AEC6CDF|nr:hydratase [Massilibacillus massiliensis]